MAEKLIENKLFILFGILIVLAGVIYFALDYFYWPEKAEVTEEAPEVITEEEQEVNVKKGDNFVIELEANPTTGYQWEVQLDSNYLQLDKREYVPDAPEDEALVGSGGYELFHFSVLKSGETEIIFTHLRPWEEGVEPIKTLKYKVNIEE